MKVNYFHINISNTIIIYVYIHGIWRGCHSYVAPNPYLFCYFLQCCVWYSPFWLTPTFSGTQLGCKTRDTCVCVCVCVCMCISVCQHTNTDTHSKLVPVNCMFHHHCTVLPTAEILCIIQKTTWKEKQTSSPKQTTGIRESYDTNFKYSD